VRIACAQRVHRVADRRAACLAGLLRPWPRQRSVRQRPCPLGVAALASRAACLFASVVPLLSMQQSVLLCISTILDSGNHYSKMMEVCTVPTQRSQAQGIIQTLHHSDDRRLRQQHLRDDQDHFGVCSMPTVPAHALTHLIPCVVQVCDDCLKTDRTHRHLTNTDTYTHLLAAALCLADPEKCACFGSSS